MTLLLKGYCLLFFALTLSVVKAQQLPITVYSSKEGNSPLGTASIFQDKKGWIWFINGYEVVRYDGQRFKTYPPATNVNVDYIFRLMEVEDEIWVLGDPERRKITGDSITRLGIDNPKLKIQDCLRHRNKTYLLEEFGLLLYEGKQVKQLIKNMLPKAASYARLIPYNDSLLLSYSVGGNLIILNLNNNSYSQISMNVKDMHRDGKGNIIMLVNGNSFLRLTNLNSKDEKYDVTTSVYYNIPDNSSKLNRFAIDHSGNIWATEPLKRLVRITTNLRMNSYTEAQGLPGLTFHDMLIDRENNLWIGYSAGAYKIRPGLWERLTKSEGLVLNQITFMAKDGENIFLGSQDGLNLYHDGRLSTLMNKSRLFSCESILASRDRIWYSRGNSFYSAKLNLESSEIVNEVKLDTVPHRIQDLKMDKHGTIFIPTGGSLYAWVKERLIKLIPDSIHYRKIVIDKNNDLWLGQFSGPVDHYSVQYEKGSLSILKIETITENKSMPPLEKIRALEVDQQGNIVIGTRYNGLFYATVKSKKVSSLTHFDTKEGLNSKNIWGICSGIDGKIWIATATGLNSLRFSDSGYQILEEGRQREIFGSAGILFDEFRQRVWVMNHPGVVYFNEQDAIPSHPFIISIATKTPRSNKYSEEPSGNKFGHTDNNFSFELSANTYHNEKSIRFVYRLLKNGDEEWSQPSSNQILNFVSLSPAEYSLHVKAVNANNQWSSNEAVYTFTILRPFWQRAWFIITVIIFVVLALYLLYRYRIRRVKEMFEMRQVIASDLHDEIGSSLTSIHILSKMSQLNVPNDQQKAQSLLERVIDQSSQIQQNMSDIVWAIRPDNDKMENMVMRMREHLNHSLEPKNISIDFIAEEKLMRESLPMEHRRDFLLIFKEAVNNIAKYSQCKMTHIRLERIDGSMRMLIEDDGIGFDVNPQRSSSGIVNMQRRAGLMKGSFRIDSAIGKGTRIEVMVPIT